MERLIKALQVRAGSSARHRQATPHVLVTPDGEERKTVLADDNLGGQ